MYIDDGVNVAQWLASLETFAGAFYKVFNKVEMSGLLGYLIKRINNGHISELGVMRSLLKKTGGYGFAETESIASLSEDQLEGRCGSLLLKRETSDFGIVEEFIWLNYFALSATISPVLEFCEMIEHII